MARVAARGRNAYINKETGQSICYWKNFPKVEEKATQFSHHVYWQIGWITDYLISEAHLRSKGAISFPRGFMTPKVGPHATYGFAPGAILGEKANLIFRPWMLHGNNPDIEYITALSEDEKQLYLIFLNQSPLESNGTFLIDLSSLSSDKVHWRDEIEIYGSSLYDIDRKRAKLKVKIPMWGLSIIKLELKK